jgi:hypothetical protein
MRLPVWRSVVAKGDAAEATANPFESWAKALGVLRNRLFAPIDIACLVFFRIAFGTVVLWEVGRFFDRGWIGRHYIEPTFHFTYFGFNWVQPWPGDWMYVHFVGLGVLATLIVIGLWYRVAMVLFFFAFTYVFLLDQARYLNHFYLISLFSFLMIFIPANRAFSLDALLNPRIQSDTVPSWTLWILRAQMGIVYFYGGLAKINSDWLNGEPMREWLADRTDFILIGRWFTEEFTVYLFSYGGLLLDLLIVPFLLWKPTRPFAFMAALGFHLTNAELFPIGIFPWFAIAATMLFLPPEWPRVVFAGKRLEIPEQAKAVASAGARPAMNLTLGLLGIYLAVQLLVPLRHHLYPGNVSWTEEGHRFAWHMRLRDKDGEAQFFATDPVSGQTWEIDTGEYLTNGQEDEMAGRPDMILQLSHHIADRLREQGYGQVEVRATVMSSLNSREEQLLIDPTVDLAAQSRSLRHADWINDLD